MLDRIRDFYDYVFYMMYRLNTWHNEDSKRKKIPYYCDVLFSSIWQMAIIIAFNLFTLCVILILLLDISSGYIRVDFILYANIAIGYLWNYYIYQRKKRYKIVIKKYAKLRVSKIPAILYGILSLVVAICSLILLRYVKEYS